MTLRASSLRENLPAAKGQEVHRETVTADEGRSKPFVLTPALVLLSVCVICVCAIYCVELLLGLMFNLVGTSM